MRKNGSYLDFNFVFIVLQLCHSDDHSGDPHSTANPQHRLLPPPPRQFRLYRLFIPDECANVPLATIPPESALAQPTLEIEANADVSKK